MNFRIFTVGKSTVWKLSNSGIIQSGIIQKKNSHQILENTTLRKQFGFSNQNLFISKKCFGRFNQILSIGSNKF